MTKPMRSSVEASLAVTLFIFDGIQDFLRENIQKSQHTRDPYCRGSLAHSQASIEDNSGIEQSHCDITEQECALEHSRVKHAEGQSAKHKSEQQRTARNGDSNCGNCQGPANNTRGG